MPRVAIIGEELRVQGYALAGAVVRAADDEASVRRAWRELPGDVAVVLLSARAASWLGGELAGRPSLLPVVMPG
jgi:vacuolar-type H+-ATPase subunit F/Vma7